MNLMAAQDLKPEERSLLITGDAGSGKSYILRAFVKRQVEAYKTDMLYFSLDVKKLGDTVDPEVLDLLTRFANHPNVTLVIDEAHELKMQGGKSILDSMMEEMADPGAHIRLILSTTTAEAQKYLKGPGSEARLRRMREICLKKLSYAEVKIILEKKIERLRRNWSDLHPEFLLNVEATISALIEYPLALAKIASPRSIMSFTCVYLSYTSFIIPLRCAPCPDRINAHLSADTADTAGIVGTVDTCNSVVCSRVVYATPIKVLSNQNYADLNGDPERYKEIASEVWGYEEYEEPEPLTEWYKDGVEAKGLEK
jgi:hypothetical protein